jgi:hypothetical protein
LQLLWELGDALEVLASVIIGAASGDVLPAKVLHTLFSLFGKPLSRPTQLRFLSEPGQSLLLGEHQLLTAAVH